MTQTVLVTGANKGIGYAIVDAILRTQSSCHVLLGSRDQQRGDSSRQQLLKETGAKPNQIELVSLDVSSSASVSELAEHLKRTNTSLHGLVNNAGTIEGAREQILNVNALGVQRMCEQLAPLMTEGGRIVNVTSASGPNYVAKCSAQWQSFFTNKKATASQFNDFIQDAAQASNSDLAQRGLPGDADYGLSKACANLYTLIVARDNPELTVHACTPGFIETDLTREMTRGSGQSAADMGMKQPADGAKVVMHLLFEAVTGSGHYFGSDAKRSPLDCYRAPGSPAYTGE